MLQQLSIDFSHSMPPVTGEQKKRSGIAKAVKTAEKVQKGWSDQAFVYVKEFISQNSGLKFLTEDIRSFAESKGFLAPKSSRAWGGPMLRAKRAGLIEAIGTQQVKNPRAHCANATVWTTKES